MTMRRPKSLLVGAVVLLTACTHSSPVPVTEDRACAVTTPVGWRAVIDAAPVLPGTGIYLAPSGMAAGWIDQGGPRLGTIDTHEELRAVVRPPNSSRLAQLTISEDEIAAVLEQDGANPEAERSWELMIVSLDGKREPQLVTSGYGSRATILVDGNLHLTPDALFWVEGDHHHHELKKFNRRSGTTQTLNSGGPLLGITYHDDIVHWVEEVPGEVNVTKVKGLNLNTGKPVEAPRPLRDRGDVLRLAVRPDLVVWTDAPGHLTVWKPDWDRPKIVIDGSYDDFFHQITFAGDFILASKGGPVWFVDERNWSSTRPSYVHAGRGYGHELLTLSTNAEAPDSALRRVSSKELTPLPDCPAS